ncbi:TPA: glycosyltransferase [Candidatus Poribacteria bacterium]|nr:glycosyltransferase [Candidatus Poribacteria bacterium]
MANNEKNIARNGFRSCSEVTILFFTKRRISKRDIILEKFGRQYQIAKELSSLGCHVIFFCIDYYKSKSIRINVDEDMEIHSHTLMTIPVSMLRLFFRRSKIQQVSVIIASGDPLVSFMAFMLSKIIGRPYIYDNQDNYDSYPIMKIPVIKIINEVMLRRSDIIVAVSERLKNLLLQRTSQRVVVIPNGVDLELFQNYPKDSSRRILGLPLSKKIICYSGSFEETNGVLLLCEAYRILARKKKDLLLLLTGGGPEKDKIISNLLGLEYIYLDLPYDLIPFAISSSDVLVIPYLSNDFSQYAFPLKLMEYLAACRPIVTTDFGIVSPIIESLLGKEFVCYSTDPNELAEKIENALQMEKVSTRSFAENYSWKKISSKLCEEIKSLLSKN